MSFIPLSLVAVLLAAAPVVAVPNPAAIAPAARVLAPGQAPAPAAINRAAFVARLDNGYRMLDADHNGAVTVAELASAETRARQVDEAAMTARRRDAFARLDTNRDGQLSRAEFDAAAAPRPAAADPAAVLSALDSDEDKKLSLTEYRARGLARFDRADANRDGIVTPAEERASLKR